MTITKILYISTLFICFGTAADVVDMILDDGCKISTIFTTTEEKSYNVIWKGGEIRSWCQLTFTGGERGRRRKKYTLCVTAEIFNISNDEFEMRFYKGYDMDFSMKYDNNSNASNIHFCAPEDEYLDIEFYRAEHKTNSYVKLVVSANITSDGTERGSPPDYQLVISLGSGILMICLVILSMIIRRRQFVRSVSRVSRGTNSLGILVTNSSRTEMSPRQISSTGHVDAPIPSYSTVRDKYAAPPPSYAEISREAPPPYEEVI